MTKRLWQGPLTSTEGRILYGGDYNPEQWPEEVWADDMRLLREANINEVTLNVFSWARLQPSEDTYDFDRLDRIVETVAGAGMSIVMATSTAALPAWMALRHPDVTRVDHQGRKLRHGVRHNPCINSATFRRYSTALAGRLAERYGSHPALVAWHVSNEYGGFCWCDTCAASFRDWLAEAYGTVEAANEAWNTDFWSHTYSSFDEVFPPNHLGDAMGEKSVLPGLSLAYRRFYGQRVRESYLEEKEAILAHDPDHPVTTNLMGSFRDLDYFEWSDILDISSWDSYPSLDTSPTQIAMHHALMRAVGRQRPFMLMEQTPSRQNWQAYNSLKRPGQMRQQSWQAVARGADTVQFFQLRQNRGGCEKFHGAVIGADGGNRTRTFREVAELGAELARLSPSILGSEGEPGRVAVVYDWNSRWGIDFSAGPSRELNYVREVGRWYGELHRRQVAVDMVPVTGPFEGYAAVLAPCLYMVDDETVGRLRAYVEGGGRLLLTPMCLLVDRDDNLHQGEAPVPLRDLAGVWAEETDALPPSRSVPLVFEDGRTGVGGVLCDVVHPDEGTRVLATYDGEYYAGTPALTFHASSGSGGVFYAATFPEGEALAAMVDEVLRESGVETLEVPDGVEVSRRVHADGRILTFVVNTADREVEFSAPSVGVDLLTGKAVGETLWLAAFGVVVVESTR